MMHVPSVQLRIYSTFSAIFRRPAARLPDMPITAADAAADADCLDARLVAAR